MLGKKIFLTGASGSLGKEVARSLLDGGFDLVLLLRPLPVEKAYAAALSLGEYAGRVQVEWGDAKQPMAIARAVALSDAVVHMAALISPMADYQIEEAMRVNYGSTLHVLSAIKNEGRDIPLLYICSLAITGDRMPPIHWGRVGDPIKPSVYDYYALSKTASERAVFESGLKRWVSLRQTGVMPPNMRSATDGIIFHQPLGNVLEWVSAEDSARLICNILSAEPGESFWRRAYNIGGGPEWRADNLTLMSDMCRLYGIKDVRDILHPSWFAAFNFHGQYYLDADELEALFHFRSGSYAGAMDALCENARNIPLPYSVKKAAVRAFMKRVALSANGPLRWIKDKDAGRIEAFFGSYEKWKSIPDWAGFSLPKADGEPVRLDHGYDEGKGIGDLTLDGLKQAAQFRGGDCLAAATDDIYAPMRWRCARGHAFSASPNLVLQGGHWCPVCESESWDYGRRAAENPFFAQVWTPLHDAGEQRIIPKMVRESIVFEPERKRHHLRRERVGIRLKKARKQ